MVMDCGTECWLFIIAMVGTMLWLLTLFIANFLLLTFLMSLREEESLLTQVLLGGQAYFHCI